ncbi:hypothetical protein NT239_09065 [Chitinibacter sp. SCUT-21]|uniref:hypothetical protein n=1 Tax=Chitinibacter sp. SCUT-21 TaxID=2970891 RepID=UPI0035A66F50
MYIAKISSPSYSQINTKPASSGARSTSSSESHGLWREDLQQTQPRDVQTPFLPALEQSLALRDELFDYYPQALPTPLTYAEIEPAKRNQARLQAYRELEHQQASGTRIAITG